MTSRERCDPSLSHIVADFIFQYKSPDIVLPSHQPRRSTQVYPKHPQLLPPPDDVRPEYAAVKLTGECICTILKSQPIK